MICVIASLLLDNHICPFSRFKEFPNKNVTNQKPFQGVEMENIRKFQKKNPPDHLLN